MENQIQTRRRVAQMLGILTSAQGKEALSSGVNGALVQCIGISRSILEDMDDHTKANQTIGSGTKRNARARKLGELVVRIDAIGRGVTDPDGSDTGADADRPGRDSDLASDDYPY